MKLTPKIHEKTVKIARAYEELKFVFGRFYEGAKYLNKPNSKITDLIFESHLESNYFNVAYLGMRLRFEFTLSSEGAETVQGIVYCLKEYPRFSESINIIGSFKFDSKKITEFEADSAEDPIEIEYYGPEIIMHYISIAIAKH